MALTKLTDIRKSLSVEIEDLQVNGITTFTNSVSIGGTLTYQDVTNIDSVGLITARSGINVSGGDVTISDSIIHLGDTNTKIRFPAADTISFETAGSERVRVDSNGNITQGVSGDATFAAINSISANAARGIEIFKDGTDTGSAIKLAGDNGSGNKAYSQLGYSGANATAHWANYNTGGTKVGEISITSAGRVGINETSPNATLHIKNADGANNRLELVHANDSANEQNKITFKNNTTEYASITSGKDGSNNSIGLTFGTGGTERLRIESGGRVLIGETSVSGSTQKLVIGNGGNENFEFSPAMTSNNLNGGLIEYLHRNDGNTRPDLNLYTGGAGAIKFYTNGTERFRIKSDGKVGIGTNNPSQIFNICGTNVKPVIGHITAHTPLYSSYNGQNNTSLEITSSGTGTNVAGLTINNPTTSANSSYKTISFSCSGTSSSEKRGCIISSNHDEDSSSTIKGNFYVSTNNGSGLQQNLQIDHDGNVTKPNSFHILVDRNGNQTGYNACDMTSVILWNRVQSSHSSTGAANYFNTSNGLFTAPKTGLYLFHVAVNCSYAVQGAWLNINGSRPSFANFYPNGANSADAMITYKVTEGHTVGVKWYYNCITNGTINSNTLHTWWRIILLG